MGNRYQARSNFDITSFQHQLISFFFSSSQSNRDITSFPRNFIVGTVFEVIWGTTNRRTNKPTNIVSYRGATSRLKNPKAFFSYLGWKRLNLDRSKTITNSADQADILNEYFATVFVEENNSPQFEPNP
jgi:hypothetical protein